MIICKVIGNVWSTKKEEGLEGMKLMIVKNPQKKDSDSFVAADFVGAGVGETVLIVRGSTARAASKKGTAPIDAAIIGIVDSQDIIGAETTTEV